MGGVDARRRLSLIDDYAASAHRMPQKRRLPMLRAIRYAARRGGDLATAAFVTATLLNAIRAEPSAVACLTLCLIASVGAASSRLAFSL